MILWPVTVVVGVFLVLAIYLYLMQDKMVFFPTGELVMTPTDIGLKYEDLFIDVDDGEKINAWLLKTTAADPSKATPVVLFCHGNGGNISHRLQTIEYTLGLGADIFLMDYRGYGRSDGKPGENEMYADVEACYDWLTKEAGYTSEQVVLFGRSLGGVAAVDLALKVPCRGLVMESSLTSAGEMAKKMFPFFPVGLILKLKLNSLEKIKSVACPVLVTHSPEDDIIPYEMGEQLFDAANRPKRFVKLRGLHNDRDYFHDNEYRTALTELLFGNTNSW